MSHTIIAPSLLAASYLDLRKDISNVTKAWADWLHIDAMDGYFVPQWSIFFDPSLLKQIKNTCQNVVADVHLMLNDPDKHIKSFADAWADIITVHQEAPWINHLDRTLQSIRDTWKKAGLALNPTTTHSHLEYVMDKVDLILVMCVNPWFGGQSFIKSQVQKIEKIKKMVDASGKKIDIQVDGWINADTAKLCKNAWANVLVAGSYIFWGWASEYKKRIQSLKTS